MALVAQLVRGIQPVVDMIYPPRCAACGEAIADQHGLCVDCWSTLEIPTAEGGEGALTGVFAATQYNDTSRKLVLAYKHGGRIALSRLLARLMAARLPGADEFAAPPLLVPVPLHRWRLWHRGFNQAALLASELAKLGKGDALVDGLIRCKRTPSLGGLGREARERALAGAIIVNHAKSAMLAGRDVVLIDDVFTSGATSRACIAAIRQARPASIAVACFARVETGEGLSSLSP
jgi:ComF family protein